MLHNFIGSTVKTSPAQEYRTFYGYGFWNIEGGLYVFYDTFCQMKYRVKSWRTFESACVLKFSKKKRKSTFTLKEVFYSLPYMHKMYFFKHQRHISANFQKVTKHISGVETYVVCHLEIKGTLWRHHYVN